MTINSGSRIIVALDDLTLQDGEILSFANMIRNHVLGFKVNALFTRNQRIAFELSKIAKLFIDMKIHDVSDTARNHAKEQLDYRPSIINCHASGGVEMMKAVKEVAPECIVLGVTVLTSLDDEECQSIYHNTAAEQVEVLAQMTIVDSCLDGIVCSPFEVLRLRELFGNEFLAVAPGIRLPGDNPTDQKRFNTPYYAIFNGASLLVVGNPITQAENPFAVVAKINAETDKALQDRGWE